MNLEQDLPKTEPWKKFYQSSINRKHSYKDKNSKGVSLGPVTKRKHQGYALNYGKLVVPSEETVQQVKSEIKRRRQDYKSDPSQSGGVNSKTAAAKARSSKSSAKKGKKSTGKKKNNQKKNNKNKNKKKNNQIPDIFS